MIHFYTAFKQCLRGLNFIVKKYSFKGPLRLINNIIITHAKDIDTNTGLKAIDTDLNKFKCNTLRVIGLGPFKITKTKSYNKSNLPSKLPFSRAN